MNTHTQQGQSKQEVNLSDRARKVYGSATAAAAANDSANRGSAGVGSAEGGRGEGKKRGRPAKSDASESGKRPKCHDAGGASHSSAGGARVGEVNGGSALGAKKELTMEEKKKAAQEIMARNIQERLGLTMEQFAANYKASSADEKKALYDSVA